jgi:hypothetical protein
MIYTKEGVKMAGSRRYKWTDAERQRLIDIYKKHGWKAGYYMDFGCNYMTCRRELARMGLMQCANILATKTT